MSDKGDEKDTLGKINQLTILNRAHYGAMFMKQLKARLLTLQVMRVANGEEPFPTVVGAVNAQGEPDPTGTLLVPPMPAPNANQGTWSTYNATLNLNKQLDVQRVEWRKLNKEGIKLIASLLSDDILQLPEIEPQLGSLPRLYTALLMFVQHQEPGDASIHSQAFESFSQLPEEQVLAYTTRFRSLVADMASRGSTRTIGEQMSVYARGLHLQGGGSLRQYACMEGTTFESLIATARRMESQSRAETAVGQYGSSIVCSSHDCAPYSALTMVAGRRNAAPGEMICFCCGGVGHYKNECPSNPLAMQRRKGQDSFGQSAWKRQRTQESSNPQHQSSSSSSPGTSNPVNNGPRFSNQQGRGTNYRHGGRVTSGRGGNDGQSGKGGRNGHRRGYRGRGNESARASSVAAESTTSASDANVNRAVVAQRNNNNSNNASLQKK